MGGAPVKVCEVDGPSILGSSWGADNMIIFGPPGGGIMRVSANGGTPEEIVKGESNLSFIRPQILPDGETVLFSFFRPSDYGFQVVVQSYKSLEYP